MEAIRILLGEDHVVVREGTRQILSQQDDLKVVGEAGNGEQVLALAERLRPDIIILDIHMPGFSAIKVTRNLGTSLPDSRVLILTAYDDDDLVLAAMDAGAAGYLLKTVRSAELIAAVRAVHRGETILHPAIAQKMALQWARRRSGSQGVMESLTPREVEVLQFACRGLRNKEIAHELSVSTRTIEGHFSSVLSKLGVSSRTAAVMHATSHSWLYRKGGEVKG